MNLFMLVLWYSTNAAKLFSIPARCVMISFPIWADWYIIEEETATYASIWALPVFNVASVLRFIESASVIMPSLAPVSL